MVRNGAPCCVQAVLASVPGLQAQVNAVRCGSSPATGTGASPLHTAPPERRPLSPRAAQPGGSAHPSDASQHRQLPLPGQGDSAVENCPPDLVQGVRNRIDELLTAIDQSPDNCRPLINKLRDAVTCVPVEVWMVRATHSPRLCAAATATPCRLRIA
jgi:hypothetical protein